MSEQSKVRLGYLIGGLMIGCFWYVNRHSPPWEEALRTIVTFALIMTLLKAHLLRRSRNAHLVPLIAAKAALVVVAAFIQAALGHLMHNPGLVVASGLGLAVALLAPLSDRHFFTRATTLLASNQESTS